MQKHLLTCCLLVLATSSVSGIKFSGNIAGARTIEECVNGYQINKKLTTTSQAARNHGYRAEEHVVQTKDGHILTLHRIPGNTTDAAPVFLQHGLLCSSYDWVLMGKEKALAFQLHDQGYDVWMGNVRGNTYSRCHTKYTTSDRQFWNFSWHEVGIYDLPAMIEYVTDLTGQNITYIGHSMGTTSFFVMAIENATIASRVKLMMALAPVTFLDHGTSPLTLLAPYTWIIKLLIRLAGKAEFATHNGITGAMLDFVCHSWMSWLGKVCVNLMFFTTGFNSKQFNYTLANDIMDHVPAGSSLNVLLHYFQLYNSGRFEYYNHGSTKNLQYYKSSEPPNYKISKIQVPVGLMWSDSDVFTHPVDVNRFREQLPNEVYNYRVPYPDFQHNDFLLGIDAPDLIYRNLLNFMKRFNKKLLKRTKK